MISALRRRRRVETPRQRSLRGLDWLNFFIANVQTGFGPFISVYLTAHEWTQAEIGLALSVGTATFMAGQIPAGALVDATRSKRSAALAAGVAVAASALLFALIPETLPVMLAEVLHGFASCVLNPALAAISLGLVGRERLGERLGRNARYAAAGNGIAAGVMGLCGTYVSDRAVFWLTAALMAPALLSLRAIRPEHVARDEEGARPERLAGAWRLARNGRLLAFAACAALFHLGNAALLPLAAGALTEQMGSAANLVIGACIVLPQAVVAVLSPYVGRAADRFGRRPVLLAGFAAVPLRGAVLAAVTHSVPVVAAQALDGISAAVFGVMMPLVCADVTRGGGHYNLAIGVVGLAAGIGATFSTSLAGWAADEMGAAAAFLALAGAGLAGVLLLLAGMPETRPHPVAVRGLSA